MSKILLLAVLLAPVAFAQDAVPQPHPHRTTVENVQKPVSDGRYCVYEDKKYSEGAIKTADGRTMICMQKEVFTQKDKDEGSELIWEYGGNGRGEIHLRSNPIKR